MTPTQTPSSPLNLRLFGPFEVEVEGRPLPPVRSRKVRWLLALLAMHGGHTLQRVWLAGMLWPDSLENKALYNLRRSLDDLRGALGEQRVRLRATARTLCLDLNGASCDVTEFDSASESDQAERLQHAVTLYRGPLLAGCSEEWVVPERVARERAYVRALERLATLAGKRGEPTAAVALWRQVVDVDPLREGAQRELMRALAESGDHAAAILVYRDLRLTLHELGASPDPATIALFEQLRQGPRSLPQVGPGPAVTTESATPAVLSTGNLLRPLTRLIGRESEVADVVTQLGITRFMTLTGTGGVGKTRLAIEIGHTLAEDYPDGVWFVELAQLAEATQVPDAVATVLGIREERGKSLLQTLCGALRPKRLLIVLDNCEHLLDACARLVVTVLGVGGGFI